MVACRGHFLSSHFNRNSHFHCISTLFPFYFHRNSTLPSISIVIPFYFHAINRVYAALPFCACAVSCWSTCYLVSEAIVVLLYCYIFFHWFCCPFLRFCSLVHLSRWYLGLCCPIFDRESATSRVYNTSHFYQKGRRYVCFMPWFELPWLILWCRCSLYSYHTYPCIKLTATIAILIYTHRACHCS